MEYNTIIRIPINQYNWIYSHHHGSGSSAKMGNVSMIIMGERVILGGSSQLVSGS